MSEQTAIESVQAIKRTPFEHAAEQPFGLTTVKWLLGELATKRTFALNLEKTHCADGLVNTLAFWRDGMNGREEGDPGVEVFSSEHSFDTQAKLERLNGTDASEIIAVLDLTKGEIDPHVYAQLGAVANRDDAPMILVLDLKGETHKTDVLETKIADDAFLDETGYFLIPKTVIQQSETKPFAAVANTYNHDSLLGQVRL